MADCSLPRQQLGHEKVVPVGILLWLGEPWNQQMALVADLVRSLLEFYAEERVMNAVVSVSTRCQSSQLALLGRVGRGWACRANCASSTPRRKSVSVEVVG